MLVQDRRNALAGIDIMRKICNHPDLLQRAKWEGADDYGNPKRSGKLAVALKVRLLPAMSQHWLAPVLDRLREPCQLQMQELSSC